VSGKVSGGVFEKGVSGARQLDQTPTRHLVKNGNEIKTIRVSGRVSGICCLRPKVLLSVWGGFFRNPQTRHSGQRA
jgi:hypothetical protein